MINDKSPQQTLAGQYSNWPLWLQVLVIAPHGILLSASLRLWRPKTDKDRRKFGFVAAYLASFHLFMHFVFHFLVQLAAYLCGSLSQCLVVQRW